MRFWEYDLRADALHIGERIKKGTFRPMVPVLSVGGVDYRPIPYSTASGALREWLGLRWDAPVHAAGYLTGGNMESLTIAPRDNVTGVSKLPITVQYLSQARGKLFVGLDEHTTSMPERVDMVMGGMRYKGYGLCHLRQVSTEPIEPESEEGILLTRIPEEALWVFGINRQMLETDGPYRWGYLFKPTSATGGVYVRSLFEESRVTADSLFIDRGGR